jgi:DNA-binding beta-propeller fold protein YncE
MFVLCLAGCERAPLTDSGVIAVIGGVGLGDGNFNYPRAIASDKQRNVFVVDKTGRIQQFDPEGQFEHSWRVPEIASGFPVGLAVHPDGRVFVADTHYHRVLVYDREGNLLTSFGHEGSGDGQFQLPTDVAFDAQGFIYVSEYHENDRVTKWSPGLKFVRALGEAPIVGVRLSRPTGLIVDDEQTLWIADACNHRIVRMSLDGELLSVFGKFGSAAGELRYPYDISQSPDGSLLVCEYEGHRLQWFSKGGRSLRIWGKAGRSFGELFGPWGAAYGPYGRVYVVDSLNSRVQVIEP